MRHTRRAVLGATAAMATGLAGCTGSSGGGTDATPTTSASDPSTDTPSPTPETAPTVRVSSHPDLGEVLVGPEGRTLYMFDRDTEGEGASSCSGGCAEAWPPLTVEVEPTAGADVTAELTTFERDDGTTQVAAGGWPLYYFASDEAPGDANGQGVNDVWWVLGPDGTPKRPEATTTPTAEPSATVRVRSHPDLGEILVGSDGQTLYMFDRDTRGSGASACSGDCVGAWPPLTVDGEPTAGDGVTAALTAFERDDGTTQVAAGGWPLYYFTRDEEPGDVEGQGVGGVWWVLGPDGTPKRPESTPTPTTEPSPTVQVRSHPDLGEILVDSEGRTLYMFDRDTREDGSSVCSGGCAESWPPLTVDGEPTAGDGVTAALTTFERPGDGTQVAANGWPLYYYARDEEAGDVEGQGAGDVWWVLGPDGRPRRSQATPTPSDGGGGGGTY